MAPGAHGLDSGAIVARILVADVAQYGSEKDQVGGTAVRYAAKSPASAHMMVIPSRPAVAAPSRAAETLRGSFSISAACTR
ncbi:hypothetical protein Pma05_54760 [Plantactinospora mayteni]|uniref:Uncharacterized protein n=1 Tax=Plantactinospora mayteni TaxID=566021 RepID=A0ABQ4EW73_9ACTN|nr:hypothetical protein Pma05_54760 [Plantactinospora mayteni]